mmetsp:Transcript_15227/g.51191  ORF Transcript_15227/g.51191 Transcript_15227/m.51191 type:complete len:204 (-) Transcript_15227:385-996(-)
MHFFLSKAAPRLEPLRTLTTRSSRAHVDGGSCATAVDEGALPPRGGWRRGAAVTANILKAATFPRIPSGGSAAAAASSSTSPSAWRSAAARSAMRKASCSCGSMALSRLRRLASSSSSSLRASFHARGARRSSTGRISRASASGNDAHAAHGESSWTVTNQPWSPRSARTSPRSRRSETKRPSVCQHVFSMSFCWRSPGWRSL